MKYAPVEDRALLDDEHSKLLEDMGNIADGFCDSFEVFLVLRCDGLVLIKLGYLLHRHDNIAWAARIKVLYCAMFCALCEKCKLIIDPLPPTSETPSGVIQPERRYKKDGSSCC